MKAVGQQLPEIMREHMQIILAQHAGNPDLPPMNAGTYNGFGMDPMINAVMRYGYGHVPQLEMQEKPKRNKSEAGSSAQAAAAVTGSSQENATVSPSKSGTTNNKKKKKGKKK